MKINKEKQLTVHIVLSIVALVIILAQSVFVKGLGPFEKVDVMQTLAQQIHIKVSFLFFVIYIVILFVEYATLGGLLVITTQDIGKQLMIGIPFYIGTIYLAVIEIFRRQILGLSFTTNRIVVCLLGLLVGIVVGWTIRRDSTE